MLDPTGIPMVHVDQDQTNGYRFKLNLNSASLTPLFCVHWVHVRHSSDPYTDHTHPTHLAQARKLKSYWFKCESLTVGPNCQARLLPLMAQRREKKTRVSETHLHGAGSLHQSKEEGCRVLMELPIRPLVVPKRGKKVPVPTSFLQRIGQCVPLNAKLGVQEYSRDRGDAL